MSSTVTVNNHGFWSWWIDFSNIKPLHAGFKIFSKKLQYIPGLLSVTVICCIIKTFSGILITAAIFQNYLLSGFPWIRSQKTGLNWFLYILMTTSTRTSNSSSMQLSMKQNTQSEEFIEFRIWTFGAVIKCKSHCGEKLCHCKLKKLSFVKTKLSLLSSHC